MRRYLASHAGATFHDIFAGVQPAAKYAVRSALQYGRKKKEITFTDDSYTLAEK